MNSSLICQYDVCERQTWFGGAVGSCNTTGVCVCPAGYTGAYVLSNKNDCHLNIAFRNALNLVTLISAACTVLAGFVSLRKVAVDIRKLYRPKVTAKSFDVSEAGSLSSVARSSGQSAAVLKRKLQVVRSIICYTLFAGCEVYRAALLVEDPDALVTEIPISVAIVYGIGLCTSTIGIFSFMYIYTTSLPKGGQLAAVLGIKYEERRYQRCVVLPTINMSPYSFVISTTLAQTVICADCLAVACFVYYMNVPVFNKIIKHTKKRGQEHKMTPKLKLAIFRCRLCIFLGIGSIANFGTVSALVSFDRRFNFILFTYLALNVHLATILGCYFLGWDFVSVCKAEPKECSQTATTAY